MEEDQLTKLTKSKTFCLLPWIHLHVLPDSTVIPCCISPYDDVYGDGKTQTISEAWNSDKYKKLRKNMLSDVPTNGCSRCYQIEESGFYSMRQRFNDQFKDHLNLVSLTSEDGSLSSIDLKYIDIRFSNLCNFKCRGCGPTLSSSWYEDHQLLFDYKSDQQKVKSVAVNSPDFWAELKSLIPHAEEIYFGGGEPLITKEHYEVLKLLEALGRYDIRLCYNTNLAQLSYGAVNLAEIWAKFKTVSLGVSIDDIGERGEYFRHGTRWATIEKNLFKLRDEYKTVHIYVNCTVNIMNVYYLPELFKYLVENKIIEPHQVNINLLLDPIELSAQVMPKKLKNKTINKLSHFQVELFSQGERYKKAAYDIRRIIQFMEDEDKSHLIPQFQKNTLRLDDIRNESFRATYPELEELLSV